VSTAVFVGGPLRDRVDVRGVGSAEARNRNNACVRRCFVSLSAWKIKRWMLWRIQDGSDKKIKTAKLSEYPVCKEVLVKSKFQKKGDFERSSEEIISAEETTQRDEEVREYEAAVEENAGENVGEDAEENAGEKSEETTDIGEPVETE